MCQPLQVGTRVIRGPQWRSGEADGGEGHPGTLRQLLGNGEVRVLWDNGQEVTCKAGADGIHELLILDTAPVGTLHRDTRCVGCGEIDIYGMMWRCRETSCTDVTLCSLCYVMDCHDVKHVFERVDTEGARGEVVKKRVASLKVRAMGIFPGARVQRGPDWIWADQDGGAGQTGEVLGYENVAPRSSRNLVRVRWDSGVTNSYRLGLEGHVDLQCVEEASGTFYYRDHLPVLDCTGQKPTSLITAIKTDTSSFMSTSSSSSSSLQSSPVTSFQGAGATGVDTEVRAGSRSDIKVGDKVAIAVNEQRLKELQVKYGGATAGMIQSIGRTGEVMSTTASGALQVKFKQLSYRFNPQVLIKVLQLSVGDVVQIRSDLDEVQVLNKRVGWKPDMDVTCGKVGKVVKVDEDGDVAVAFGHCVHLYAPACCQQVTGVATDTLQSSSPHNTGQSDLHQKLMQMLAEIVQEREVGGEKESEMGQMFKAISRGDLQAVHSVCMADNSLLRQVHKGMTLLMVASHEGRRDIVTTLLDLGANINQAGHNGNTALGAALEGKKEPIAVLLLQRGANVNQLNNQHTSPAHLAAYNNLQEALTEIIKRGGNINLKDSYGDTPLHDAIKEENREVTDILIAEPSLNLHLQDSKGFNMLQLACFRGNAYAVEKILKRDSTGVDELMPGGFTALQIAVTNDHMECARLLIDEGKAALNVRGSQGLTALHLACNEAYPRCVELLINNGAAVNITADDGNTPLHLAVGTKSSQLQKNPSPDMEQQEYRNRVRIAVTLLENGAFIDATNDRGAEPLKCCRPEYIRNALTKFITEHPHMVKRKRGGRCQRTSSDTQRAPPDDVQAALRDLIPDAPDATKQLLQEQCKQS